MYMKRFKDVAAMAKFLRTTKKKEFGVMCYFGDIIDGNFVVASRTPADDKIQWVEFQNGHIINVEHI